MLIATAVWSEGLELCRVALQRRKILKQVPKEIVVENWKHGKERPLQFLREVSSRCPTLSAQGKFSAQLFPEACCMGPGNADISEAQLLPFVCPTIRWATTTEQSVKKAVMEGGAEFCVVQTEDHLTGLVES